MASSIGWQRRYAARPNVFRSHPGKTRSAFDNGDMAVPY
jgi:hypothetical protein